ncbi:unnamed protein product [Dimorphilus gyrociliatus]|uniref:NACHT domain-containing protein n=1 Tax=Dimorphilus gyrociliatus TaxID=2664684 RepID=A0A7I8WEM5_9ANNE|nr:unnamed protein product [Dimorphilus gyrociliatus]
MDENKQFDILVNSESMRRYAFASCKEQFKLKANPEYMYNLLITLLPKEIKTVEFLNLKEPPSPEGIEKLWELLENLNIRNSLMILKNADLRMIADNIEKAWSRLINEVKEKHSNEHSFVQVLPFGKKYRFQVKDIVTPIEVIKINKSMFKQCQLPTEITFYTFHEVLLTDFGKIVIQGEPGIGKSVHVKYLLNSWANNKWKEFNDKLFLLISIKDVFIESRLNNNTSLYQLIKEQNFPKDSCIDETMIKEWFKEKRKDIILFIDGADELNSGDNNSNSWVTSLNSIIEGVNCSLPTVVWCRNWRAEEILFSCDLALELIGFNRQQLKEFFQKFEDNTKCNSFIEELDKANIGMLKRNMKIKSTKIFS